MRKTTNFKRSMAPTPELNISVEHQSAPPDTMDATDALKRQIDATREADRLQREQAANAPMAHTMRETAFLKANPDFMDDRDLAMKALMLAHGHNHVHDSEDFHSSVQHYFDSLKAPDSNEPESPARNRSPEPPSRTLNLNVQAPVSRESFANGGVNAHGERPGRVTLSVAQKEAARYSGISEREYAEQLLRLREEKANGHHTGNP